jgi:uncharacterized protein
MLDHPRLLVGRVMHRRLRPVEHRFSYPVFYLQLPLHRLDAATCAVFSIDRFNLLSLHRKDHGPRDGTPLLPWVQALLQARGLPADGPVVLQTFPRLLGFVFNPVSFWFCHDRSGRPIAVLAEVNNTFGGHHAYLLHNENGAPLVPGQVLKADKRFHVSPFCEVRGHYQFRFEPARAMPRLSIDYDDGQGALLKTSIHGQPRPWSARALLTAVLRMPLLTPGVVLRIHWQAWQLWRKGVPFLGTRPAIPPAQTPPLEPRP